MSDKQAKARILVVDDEPVNLALIAGVLSPGYHVLAGAATGYEGLARAQADRPDLILTDIAMPDLTGYDLCRALKEDPVTRAIPVIFFSGAIGLEEHLAGHAAGGEDFLAKPLKPAELLLKVSHALGVAEERRQLAASADNAFHTAMTAMSSAAELGVVLRFVRDSFSCANYAQLADSVIAVCGEFGLDACIRLRGRSGTLARNRSGTSSALEASIMERLSEFGRMVDFSQRTAINYEHASVMITDMPRDDEERYGRLRDHLAILCESASARVRALDDAIELHARHTALASLVDHTRDALADIDRRHRDNHNDARLIMHRMLATVEQSLARLDLTDEQENYLTGVMHAAVENVMDLFSRGLAIDDHLSQVTSLLGHARGATQGSGSA